MDSRKPTSEKDKTVVEVEKVRSTEYRFIDNYKRLPMLNDHFYIRLPCSTGVDEIFLVLEALNCRSSMKLRHDGSLILPRSFRKPKQGISGYLCNGSPQFSGNFRCRLEVQPQIPTRIHEDEMSANLFKMKNDIQRGTLSEMSSNYRQATSSKSYFTNLSAIRNALGIFSDEFLSNLGVEIFENRNCRKTIIRELNSNYLEGKRISIIPSEIKNLKRGFEFYFECKSTLTINGLPGNFMSVITPKMEQAKKCKMLLHFSGSAFKFHLFLNNVNCSCEGYNDSSANPFSSRKSKKLRLRPKAIKDCHSVSIDGILVKIDLTRNRVFFDCTALRKWFFDNAGFLKPKTQSICFYNQFLNKISQALPTLRCIELAYHETKNAEPLKHWDLLLVLKEKFFNLSLILLQNFKHNHESFMQSASNKLYAEPFCFIEKGEQNFSVKERLCWRTRNKSKRSHKIPQRNVLSRPCSSPEIDDKSVDIQISKITKFEENILRQGAEGILRQVRKKPARIVTIGKSIADRRDLKLTTPERDINAFPVNYFLKAVKEAGRSFNSFGKHRKHPLPSLVIKADIHYTEDIINSTPNDEHDAESNFREILTESRSSEEIRGVLPDNLKLAVCSKQRDGFIFVNALLKERAFVGRGIIKSVPVFGIRGSGTYGTFLIITCGDFVCLNNARRQTSLILGTQGIESTFLSVWKTVWKSERKQEEPAHLLIPAVATRRRSPETKLQESNHWSTAFREKTFAETMVTPGSPSLTIVMLENTERVEDMNFYISGNQLLNFGFRHQAWTGEMASVSYNDCCGTSERWCLLQSFIEIFSNGIDTLGAVKPESMVPEKDLMAILIRAGHDLYQNAKESLIVTEAGISAGILKTISANLTLNEKKSAISYPFTFGMAIVIGLGKKRACGITFQRFPPLSLCLMSKIVNHRRTFITKITHREGESRGIHFKGFPIFENCLSSESTSSAKTISRISRKRLKTITITKEVLHISISARQHFKAERLLLVSEGKNDNEDGTHLRAPGLYSALEDETNHAPLGIHYETKIDVVDDDYGDHYQYPPEKESDEALNREERNCDAILISSFETDGCLEGSTSEDAGVKNPEDDVSMGVVQVLRFLLSRAEAMSSTDQTCELESECAIDELSYLYLGQLFDQRTSADDLDDSGPKGTEADIDKHVSEKCQNTGDDTLSDSPTTCQRENSHFEFHTRAHSEAACAEINRDASGDVIDSSISESASKDALDVVQALDKPDMNSLNEEMRLHLVSSDHKFTLDVLTQTAEMVTDIELIKELPNKFLCCESSGVEEGAECRDYGQYEAQTSPEDINLIDEDKLDSPSSPTLETIPSEETKNPVSTQTGQINVVYGHETLIVGAAEAGCEGAMKEGPRLGPLCEPEGVVLGQKITADVQELFDGKFVPPEITGTSVKSPESLIRGGSTGKNDVSGNGPKRKLPLQRKMRSLSFSSALKFGKSEVATLVEEHLRDVYVPFATARTQLVRQCRDMLLCEYQGNFQKFRDVFLVEAASLLRNLKSEYPNCVCFCQKSTSTPLINFKASACRSCEGWPLCFNGRLVIHIGELDEAFLRPGDFYICLKKATGIDKDGSKAPEGHLREVYLSFRYRQRQSTQIQEDETSATGDVIENKIDETKFGSLFAMDWLEPTESNLMFSDERLTTVLQHLLLSVERGIERLEWDSVVKAWQTCTSSAGGQGSRCCHLPITNTKDSSVQTNSSEDLTVVSKGADGQQNLSESSGGQLPLNSSSLQEEIYAEDTTTHINGHYENEALNLDSRRPSRGDDVSALRLSSGNTLPADEEPDDGYCEHTLTQPTTLSQVDQDLLCSQVALLPGCRDSCGRSVVIISGLAMKRHSPISPCHLAQLLLYFYTIPKKEIISRGLLVLIDANDENEDLWNVLDETFCLLEANVTNALSQVLLYSPSVKSSDISKFFSTCRIQCEIVNSYDKLLTFIRKDQLLVMHGGSYIYDHQEWISFRRFLEPFINGCHLSGRNLLNLLEELRGSRLPPSSSLTHQMIEKQKKSVQLTFQDEQLRHLEEEGDTVLKELESYRTRSPHNADYRDNLERTSDLYDKLRKAMAKVSELADKRLQRLEECLQMRTFQEESSQVLSWLCRKGTESLEKHQGVADSLGAIKEQEEEFEKFYFLAMRQIERGNDLLEEASILSQEHSLPKIREETQTASDEDSGVQELASSLKQHLGSFSEKLEGTRERIEDTAKCYQLMDKSYEWALEAMRFVSQLGLVNAGNPEGIVRQIRCLQEYLEDHLPIADDTFQEVVDLATKLGNDRLVEQCKVAKLRCQETVDLIQARQSTLIKLKQQIEVDSFRGPLWDGEDGAPTPRTSRSNSQPVNMWIPPGSNSSYSLCLGHFRRRSDSTTISSAPQNYGSPIGSYTSFPSSYYPTAKDSYHLDSYAQNQKEDQILQRGLITDDLTYQGPVASLSRGYLDSRLGHKDGTQSLSSASSSSGSSTSKGPTSVLRSSGRGTYSAASNGCVNLRWNKRHTRKSQTWQVREETLEKIKNEVREQNALLQVEKCQSPMLESSDDSTHSNPETDFSPSSESSCKVPHSNTRPDPPRGPVPVNTHLLTSGSSPDSPDSGIGSPDPATDAEAKAKKTLMLIMKEMIQTERDYVNSLEYIIENYIPELLREDIPQALRGQRNVVFGNIEKIYEFHSQYFLNELELCEITPFVVGQCFLKYEPQFYLYALYNKNKPKSDALMIEYGNLFFRKKQLELEDKMDLASYLLKPVQRMGKYALLLKQLLKECPEREAEHQDLKISEEMVRFQLRHGNDLLAMDALRDCDVNVKEQGRLLRQDEFLVWQGRSRKCLRHVFLFEDLILFSKARRDPQRKGYEMYQYKQSIKTTDMGLTEQVGDSPTKFEIWFRKRKLNDTYLLQAPNTDVKAAWVHELSKLLWKQALRNRGKQMRLAEMSSMGIGNKPCLDIKPTEDQIRDRSISLHQLARAPRFRNSIGMPPYDMKSAKRPHSIISVSSSSSSGSSQSSFTFYGTLNLGFEPGDTPPRVLHRSLTQQSQCSTESGFCTDQSTVGDSPTESDRIRHKKAERSDSLLSSDSISTSTTPSELNCSPCEEHAAEESLTTSM